MAVAAPVKLHSPLRPHFLRQELHLLFSGELLKTLRIIAETVEKVQMATSDNFVIILAPLKINNLQATENRKMSRFKVFRQSR